VRRKQGRLREDLGLKKISLHVAAVELARRAGFNRAAIVDPRLLEERAHRARSMAARDDHRGPGGRQWGWITEPRSWSATSTLLVCCLSCFRREPDDPGGPGDPHALVAPFARAHYYRTAVAMLRTVADGLELTAGIPRSSVRLFSNSRLPEKPLLAATGIAAYGKNGCMLVPGLGSQFVIAGAVIPVPTGAGPFPPPVPTDPCGSCRRCLSACPVRAIERPYVVRGDLCLQGKAGSCEEMPAETMELWGSRLYGCQDCQSACPHNRGLSEPAPAATGEIGPGVPLRQFLSEDAPTRTLRFRGTALGMSWVAGDALLRNALVAAGNRGDGSIRAEVEAHVDAAPDPVRRAARWARERL
jgi:epoxyqueuosine reductase